MGEDYETIDHPVYYGGETDPYEVVKVAEAWGWDRDAYLFNVLKYLRRAGNKPGVSAAEDYRKALWYLERRAEQEKGEQEKGEQGEKGEQEKGEQEKQEKGEQERSPYVAHFTDTSGRTYPIGRLTVLAIRALSEPRHPFYPTEAVSAKVAAVEEAIGAEAGPKASGVLRIVEMPPSSSSDRRAIDTANIDVIDGQLVRR